MNEWQAIGLGLGAIAVSLLGIASVWALSIYKSPKEDARDLALAIDKLRQTFEDAIEKIEEEQSMQRRDHNSLAQNTGILSNEVKHLADNVKTLGEEVKNLWRRRGAT